MTTRKDDRRGVANGHRKLLYGLAGLGGLTALWGIHRLTAPEPTDIFPDSLSGREPPGDPRELARTLATNLNAPYLEGNRIRLLENGDEIFPAMLEAIRSAERSVNFLTFIYWTGDIAREFARALAGAARRGVEVRVLLDAFGAARMPEDLTELMEDAGCRVAWFHSIRWYTLRRFNSRTHRKVLVADGRLGFTGGVGIAEEWTGDARGPGEWRDDHFEVEGPAVRYLQGAFAENWRQATGEALSGDAVFPTLEARGDAVVVPVLGQPKGSISRIGFLYWLSIRAARRRLRLATPYYAPDDSLQEAVESAARAGVDVRLLVPNHRIDKPLVRRAARARYPDLLEAGARVWEFEPAMMHTKVLTADDAWSVIGSANFDNRSFDLNYEVSFAVVDPALTRTLVRSFDADVERAREVTREELEARGPLERIRDGLALRLREQL